MPSMTSEKARCEILFELQFWWTRVSRLHLVTAPVEENQSILDRVSAFIDYTHQRFGLFSQRSSGTSHLGEIQAGFDDIKDNSSCIDYRSETANNYGASRESHTYERMLLGADDHMDSKAAIRGATACD